MSDSAAMSEKQITTGETLSLISRSLKFVWPYWPQILIKLILSFIGIAIILFLPWPLKFLIDYVLMGPPVGSSPTPIPPYIQPFVELMYGMTPLEIVWMVIAVCLLSIVLIGSFGTGISRDTPMAIWRKDSTPLLRAKTSRTNLAAGSVVCWICLNTVFI